MNDVAQNPSADHFTQGFASIKALGERIEGVTLHPVIFGKYEKLLDESGQQLTTTNAARIIKKTSERLASQPQFNSIFQIPANEFVEVIGRGGVERLLASLVSGGGFSRQNLPGSLNKEAREQLASLIKSVSPETSGDVDIQLLRTWSERPKASVLTADLFDQAKCRRQCSGFDV